MTAQEVLTWLKKQPFHPFRVTMNNGETYEVAHPELALVAESGALYVFEPALDSSAQVKQLPSSLAIRNISTIELIESVMS